MEVGGYVKASSLTTETINKLIDRGERFYVYDDEPIFDDSCWTADDSFWGNGEQEPKKP